MHDEVVDDFGGQQADLHDDASVLLEYGQQHPDTWTGLRFDGGRLVALFTDPDAHRADVAALVAHPERVSVQAAKRTEREVLAVLAQVRDRLESVKGRWSGFGPRLGVVSVDLRGNAEDIARELHERFGDAVALRVGAHDYPYAEPGPPAALLPAPRSTLQVAAALVAIPDSSVITTGETVSGQVEITNATSADLLALDTDQPLDGCLLEHDQVAGVTTAFRAGTGQRVRLGPGERMTIPFFAGTDSRDPRRGPTLPPGRYQLVVTIPIHSLGDSQLREQLVTPAVPVDIVAAPTVLGKPNQG